MSKTNTDNVKKRQLLNPEAKEVSLVPKGANGRTFYATKAAAPVFKAEADGNHPADHYLFSEGSPEAWEGRVRHLDGSLDKASVYKCAAQMRGFGKESASEEHVKKAATQLVACFKELGHAESQIPEHLIDLALLQKGFFEEMYRMTFWDQWPSAEDALYWAISDAIYDPTITDKAAAVGTAIDQFKSWAMGTLGGQMTKEDVQIIVDERFNQLGEKLDTVIAKMDGSANTNSAQTATETGTEETDTVQITKADITTMIDEKFKGLEARLTKLDNILGASQNNTDFEEAEVTKSAEDAGIFAGVLFG